jgi:gliding motility-associated-like protein
MVVGKSASGCIDSAFLNIDILPLDDIYLPSAFTPNGDGKNDIFQIIGSVTDIDFRVFNRWGQMVFFTQDKGKGWNGTIGNKPSPNDVYIYTLTGKNKAGQLIKKKGTITLIR